MKWPHDIAWITDDLAVAGAGPREDPARLLAVGIGAVIDARGEVLPDRTAFDRAGVSILHLPTPDKTGPTRAALDRAVAFAAMAERRGRRLLVHCTHGIGRSATVAAAVLVARGHAPLVALELLKTGRPCISLSPDQHRAWAAWLAGRVAPELVPSFAAITPIIWRHLDQVHAAANTAGSAS